MNRVLRASSVSYREALATYLPLAAMWIVMGIEQPALTAVIARLPDATVQLGAFGVTFSLALIVESPILQMLSAGTAMAKDERHYAQLLRFMHWIGGVLFAIHLLLSLPPVFAFLVGRVAGVPAQLVAPAQRAFLWMVLFAPAVGYRRLWQGMLIRYGEARLVPITMVIRLVVTGGLLALGLTTQYAEGAQVAAIAIVGGVLAGMGASYLFARPVLKQRLAAEGNRPAPDMKELLKFYLPLALTSIIVLASRPILTFGIAQAPMAVRSLAAWPVIISFHFLFFSLALALQEAVITLLRSPGDYYKLRRFALGVGLAISALYFAIVLSPLGDIWFEHVAGLTPELLELVTAPTAILAVSPIVGALVFFFRGINVQQERTGGVTRGVLVNFGVLLAVLWSGALLLPIPGVVSAATAFTLALVFEVLYLHRFTNSFSLQGLTARGAEGFPHPRESR